MSMIHQKISLKGDQGYGRKVPPRQIGLVLSVIEPAVRRSIRMAIQGRSTSRSGRNPEWLAHASDIRFVDISGRKDTILHFEAPMLGDAAPDLFQQQELWPSKPPPEATGFDLLNYVILDVVNGNTDSDRFDRQLLTTVSKFGQVFNGAYQEMQIERRDLTNIPKSIINMETIRIAREMGDQTPAPRRIRVTGRLDMIRVSTRSFELELKKGDLVRGVFESGPIEELSALLNERVMVEGKAVYRPSGRVLRIDANSMELCKSGQKLWEELPSSFSQKLEKSLLRVPQSSKKGIAAFFGTWPGDESDKELLDALESIS